MILAMPKSRTLSVLAPRLGEEEVLRLDVAVRDVLLVRHREGAHRRVEEENRLAAGRGAAASGAQALG